MLCRPTNGSTGDACGAELGSRHGTKKIPHESAQPIESTPPFGAQDTQVQRRIR